MANKVEYTQQDRQQILNAEGTVKSLTDEINILQAQYDGYENQAAQAQTRLNECTGKDKKGKDIAIGILTGGIGLAAQGIKNEKERNECIKNSNIAWDNARKMQAAIMEQLENKKLLLSMAKDNLTKLIQRIDARIANELNINKQEVENEVKLAQDTNPEIVAKKIQAQSELEKAKLDSEANKKKTYTIAGVVIGLGIVAAIVFIILRK